MEFADPGAAESLKEAEAASARAYVPYSRFRMGAAVMTATNAGGPDLLVVVSDGREIAPARLGELAPRLPFKGLR